MKCKKSKNPGHRGVPCGAQMEPVLGVFGGPCWRPQPCTVYGLGLLKGSFGRSWDGELSVILVGVWDAMPPYFISYFYVIILYSSFLIPNLLMFCILLYRIEHCYFFLYGVLMLGERLK